MINPERVALLAEFSRTQGDPSSGTLRHNSVKNSQQIQPQIWAGRLRYNFQQHKLRREYMPNKKEGYDCASLEKMRS